MSDSQPTSKELEMDDIDPLPPKCTGAPERIWLVVGDIEQDSTFGELTEVTWCTEEQYDNDIEYVRADRASAHEPPHCSSCSCGAAQPPSNAMTQAEEISEGIRHDWGTQTYTLPERDLVALTALLDEHPEWWDHPCLCAECRTHG